MLNTLIIGNLYLNNIVCQSIYLHRFVPNYTLMNNITSILIGTSLIEYNPSANGQ